MEECIFCKIVQKSIPGKIVYEDSDTVCFLDIHPRSKGMCIVASRKHFATFDQNPGLASKMFDVALIVAEKIKNALNPETVFISMMAAQVPHFHYRVYPVYKDAIPLIENKPLEVAEDELNGLAQKIMNATAEWKGRQATEKVEEKEEEEPKEEEKKEERSEDESYWIKRETEIG